MSKQRPSAVTVIVVLQILDGLWGLVTACALLFGGGALAAMILGFVRDAPQWVAGVVGGVLIVVGLIVLLFAVFDFVLAWGIWALRRWAWWLTMIVAVLSILPSLVTLAGGNLTSVPSVAFNGVIIGLLLTQDVRRTFGVG